MQTLLQPLALFRLSLELLSVIVMTILLMVNAFDFDIRVMNIRNNPSNMFFAYYGFLEPMSVAQYFMYDQCGALNKHCSESCAH